MSAPALRMRFADREALAGEVESNLRHGRAFVSGPCDLEALSECELVLEHPEGWELSLRAQVVMVSDTESMRGAGIELRPFDASIVSRIERFVREAPELEEEVLAAEVAATQPQDGETAAQECVADTDITADEDRSPPPGADPQPSRASETDADTPSEACAPLDSGESDASPAEQAGATASEQAPEQRTEAGHAASQRPAGHSSLPPDVQPQSRQQFLRKLTLTQQQKIARTGELADRVAVERMYGKAVWEGLLRNPKLTIPEVTRIARKGTVPRPLLDLIVDNAAWLRASPVRRALLSNPRVGADGLDKVLRFTPRHELKLIQKQTSYGAQVREAARRMLARG